MPTSSTEIGHSFLVTFPDEGGVEGPWLLIEGGRVTARGVADEVPVPDPETRTVLAIPGELVTIHWLDLAGGLAQAQAAAAARLMLADASAGNLADMHVAVGLPEAGLTPVVLVPAALMVFWVAAADPDKIVPTSLLLHPPAAGMVRRDKGRVPDYRGPAAAFSVEPDLAALLIGDASVEPVDEATFEGGLGAALWPPVINLRQGQFANRRRWSVDRNWVRRVAMYAIAFVLLTLVVQLALIMRYTFAADRLEAETVALAAAAPAGVRDVRPGFGPLASHLFEAVRATPNVEVTRIDYRPDGALAATVEVDSPATLAAFRQRIEAGGVAVDGGTAPTGGPQPGAELVLRPA
ncbi:MAG TPA: type II secretion system protein GspL [Allosphingosinicella sp.]